MNRALPPVLWSRNCVDPLVMIVALPAVVLSLKTRPGTNWQPKHNEKFPSDELLTIVALAAVLAPVEGQALLVHDRGVVRAAGAGELLQLIVRNRRRSS